MTDPMQKLASNCFAGYVELIKNAWHDGNMWRYESKKRSIESKEGRRIMNEQTDIDRLPIEVDFDFVGCSSIEMEFHEFNAKFVHDLCYAHEMQEKILIDINGGEWYFKVLNVIMNADVGELTVLLRPVFE